MAIGINIMLAIVVYRGLILIVHRSLIIVPYRRIIAFVFKKFVLFEESKEASMSSELIDLERYPPRFVPSLFFKGRRPEGKGPSPAPLRPLERLAPEEVLERRSKRELILISGYCGAGSVSSS